MTDIFHKYISLYISTCYYIIYVVNYKIRDITFLIILQKYFMYL